MDQDLLRRCMAVIEQLGLPVGPETLAEAMDLLARSQQGTAPGRETPPPPTSAEREEALRAEISGHINAWAARHREDHENPFRFANAECLKAGFGQRELLGEAELTRLLLYVRRRFPRS